MVAVAARTMDSAREFAAKFCVERSYGSYDSLCKDDDIGKSILINYAILICTTTIIMTTVIITCFPSMFVY